jgi:hypothetical protein
MPSGGARQGAGRKKKPLAEKLLFGNPGHETADKLVPRIGNGLKADSIPPIPDYVKNASEKLIDSEAAERIFVETWEWINAKGCCDCIKKELVDGYVVNVARWIGLVEKTNMYGQIHRTASNTVATSQSYKEEKDAQRDVRESWAQILLTVNQNSTVYGERRPPHDDIMARLLAET